MSIRQLESVHPVSAFVRKVRDRGAELADFPTWTMTTKEQRATLLDLVKARTELDALYLKVLAEADAAGVGDDVAAASAADWVAVQTRQVRPQARADLKLAKRLPELPVLAAGMARGEVNPPQARAIVRALDQLPEPSTEAEQHLVDLAAQYDAKELAILGGRIFEVLAPDRADELEGEALAREDATAARKTAFAMHTDPDGIVHGRFRTDQLHGAMIEKLMLAVHDPKTPDNPRQRGLDFNTLIEQKCPTHLVVTIAHDRLLAGLGAAQLETGGRISAGEARRLACRAGVIPAVLGSGSVVLDLGRRTRFHTEPQRIALALRDGGCSAEGCDRPPALCQAHHDVPWSQGGGTSVENGRLLCGHHHRRIHDPAYLTKHLSNGKVSFHRRT